MNKQYELDENSISLLKQMSFRSGKSETELINFAINVLNILSDACTEENDQRVAICEQEKLNDPGVTEVDLSWLKCQDWNEI